MEALAIIGEAGVSPEPFKKQDFDFIDAHNVPIRVWENAIHEFRPTPAVVAGALLCMLLTTDQVLQRRRRTSDTWIVKRKRLIRNALKSPGVSDLRNFAALQKIALETTLFV